MPSYRTQLSSPLHPVSPKGTILGREFLPSPPPLPHRYSTTVRINSEGQTAHPLVSSISGHFAQTSFDANLMWNPPPHPGKTPEATPNATGAAAARTDPLSVPDRDVYDDPMEYVGQRSEAVHKELISNPERPAILSRLELSKTFTTLGRAAFYTFVDFVVTDDQTGGGKRLWRRKMLIGDDALSHFESVGNCQLW